MPISEARKTAYLNLVRIDRDQAFSTEVIAASADRLPKKDRNLAHKLTLGVLRKQRILDYIAGLYSKKSPDKLDLEILIILRLAIYQLHFLDRIPDYTAINEAVEMTRFAKKKSAAGFVNAVLRKASKWNGAAADDPAKASPALSVSHPEWLYSKWEGDFGPERAYLIANANNSEPRSSFRMTVRFDRLDDSKKIRILEEFRSSGTVSKSGIAPGAYVTERIDGFLRELSDDGLIYFQDEASQLVADIVVRNGVGPILDLCGAPGSKATQIARKRQGKPIVVAGDLHRHRAQLMKENALRQGVELAVLALDGEGPLPFRDGALGTVLVDAPCSGTGTIRRNPEIRYRVNETSIAALQSKQLKLLRNASKLVKSGGVLIYSTCSIEPEENEEVIWAFLRDNTAFELFDPGPVGVPAIEPGMIRTFPDLHETDGFFAACMRKR